MGTASDCMSNNKAISDCLIDIWVLINIFGRLFVKRFALCYQTVVCPVCLSVVTLVCCGQTAGWMKIPLGTEVGLGPGDTVLDWDPAPPPGKRHSSPPHFRPMTIVANGRPSQQLLSTCYHCLLKVATDR